VTYSFTAAVSLRPIHPSQLMKTQLLTGVVAAATALTGFVGQTAPAVAFSWNSQWSQPTISSKTQTGFDDAPFQQFVQAERVALPNADQFLLDPSKLTLSYDHNVKVYFINEGAGYRNQLAYEATGSTSQTGLIFSDISSAESVGAWGGDALNLGDSVDLGLVKAGTQLDFWLRADGLNRGRNANIFGTQTADNPDGLQHVVAYAYNNYLLLGFEDLYGERGATGIDPTTGKANEQSDRDFNDAVFVIDLGEDNIRELVDVPEPSSALALLGAGLLGMISLRRRAKFAQ